MGYPLDVAAQVASLKAWFGDARAASAPSSWQIALWNGHPLVTGTAELAATGGYARLVVANSTANFPDPDPTSGVLRSIALTEPAPTGAWSDVATYFVLYDAADGVTRWYAAPLGQAISITGAGPAFTIQLAIRWNTEGN